MRMPHSPIGALMTEHRLIQRVVEDMRREMGRIDEEKSVEPNYIYTVVDFLKTYADRCHHGKEEDILFRRLADKPMSDDHKRVMEGLIEDHRFSRATTAKMVEATRRFADGEADALGEIKQHLQALVDLYPRHIETEDHSFFRPAIEYFSKEERDAMQQEFEEFERTLLHERYEGVVEELESARKPVPVSQ